MHNEKSLATLLVETRDELKAFFITRVGILKAEIEEKVRTWKYVIPILLTALALLLGGWVALTFAIMALLHGMFMPSPYAWMWAALIVAAAYLSLGVALGWFAYGELSTIGIFPNRTMQVLKGDQVWLQNEARTA